MLSKARTTSIFPHLPTVLAPRKDVVEKQSLNSKKSKKGTTVPPIYHLIRKEGMKVKHFTNKNDAIQFFVEKFLRVVLRSIPESISGDQISQEFFSKSIEYTKMTAREIYLLFLGS